MSDTTEKQPKVMNTIQELRKTTQMVEEVLASLQSQRDILRQRGMNLPPTVLSSLLAVKNDCTRLERSLIEEQTELQQLRALADMSAEITTSLEVATVLEETMDLVIALTGAERGYLILIDADTHEFDYRIMRDNTGSDEHMISGKQPELSSTIVTKVLESQEPLLADNAYQDERLQSNVSVANFALRSVLCVPLTYKEETFGVVYVDNRLQAGIFTEREKQTLTAFANTAAVAIANARLYANIQTALDEITQVKQLMDNVFASIGSGIIATDAQDVITTFNRAAEAILDIPAEGSVGRLINIVLPKITADLHEHLTDIREKRESQILDAELTTDKRGRIAITMKLSPLKDSQDQTRGVAVVLDDVTEKRERDQQLHIMKTYLPPEMVDKIHEISNLALGGERRDVTCLFVEVRPLSTLQDVRPGEIMAILNTYLEVGTRCVHETRGIVDKYMGNEVMGLWNTQLNPQDHHAHLAVECALMIRDEFVKLYQSLGINPDPHYYRVGINTGEATLGNVGSLNRRDFTAIGDTINLSKRLEENATQGQIIIGEDTRQHMMQSLPAQALKAYRFEELAPIQVKGRTQKSRIYEVFRQNGG